MYAAQLKTIFLVSAEIGDVIGINHCAIFVKGYKTASLPNNPATNKIGVPIKVS